MASESLSGPAVAASSCCRAASEAAEGAVTSFQSLMSTDSGTFSGMGKASLTGETSVSATSKTSSVVGSAA